MLILRYIVFIDVRKGIQCAYMRCDLWLKLKSNYLLKKDENVQNICSAVEVLPENITMTTITCRLYRRNVYFFWRKNIITSMTIAAKYIAEAHVG